MKNLFNKITIGVGLLLAVSTISLQAQLPGFLSNPFGANDNGSLQLWAFPQTIIGGQGSTNAPTGIDISAFHEVTVFITTTNAYSNVSTNNIALYRGLNATWASAETTAYKTIQVVVPATSYLNLQTNLVPTDISGQGFLFANLTVNANSVLSTNGSGVGYSGVTNTSFPFTAGVSEKILHQLR